MSLVHDVSMPWAGVTQWMYSDSTLALGVAWGCHRGHMPLSPGGHRSEGTLEW